MSVLAHTSSTLTSILSAISTTANTASTSITVASSGLDMLDAYITKAKAQQRIEHILEMDTYQAEAIAKAAEAHQETMERILKKAHADPVRKIHYDQIHDRLSQLFVTAP